MSENAARRCIKNLIYDNKNQLVVDLTMQGSPREIHQITTSTSTPPTGYFFISVSVTGIRSKNKNNNTTASIPQSLIEYYISIELSDYAISDPNEDQLFEKMDYEFRLLSDRIISLIKESRWITDSTTNISFRLDNDRSISKNNVDVLWEEAAQYHSLLGSQITFTLLQECVDGSKLY